MAGLILFTPTEFLISWFHDDSFFYLRTAQHVAAGDGSTFDGINLTNGYHPAWLLLVALLFKILPLHDGPALRLVMGLETILYAGAVCLVVRIARAAGMRRWLIATTASAVLLTGFADFGQEAHLCTLCSMLLVFLAIRAGSRTCQTGDARAVVLAGLAAAVTVFVRVDTILTVIGVGLVVAASAAHRSLPRALSRATFYFLPPATTVASIGIYNWFFFGHFETVSAFLKATTPALGRLVFFTHGTFGIRLRLALVFLCCGVFVVVVACRLLLRTRPGPAQVVLGAFASSSILYTAGLLVCGTTGPGSWHLAPALVCAALCGGMLAEELTMPFPRFGRWMAVGATTIAILASGLYVYKNRLHHDDKWGGYQLALWMPRHLPVDTVVFAVDGAGLPGFFAQRPVINGDGLINSWEYQDFVRRRDVATFLSRESVTHLLFNRPPNGDYYELRIPTWHGPSYLVGKVRVDAVIIQMGSYALVPLNALVIQSP
jgi:hypothetical protein